MSERTTADVAYEALNLARQNARDIEGHEDICAERYQNIHEKLGMLFRIIAWAGGSAFLIVMGLLGFLAKAQFEQIKALQDAAVQRAALIERVQPQPPQVIIQRAPGQSDIGASVERQQH